MEESAYDAESLLQKLLADHPDLLAGEQINAEEPRRWLLVTRESSDSSGCQHSSNQPTSPQRVAFEGRLYEASS